LTVPQTASVPISPPGNSSGSTTKLSVVKASRAPGSCSAIHQPRLVLHPGGWKAAVNTVLDQVAHRLAAAAMGQRHTVSRSAFRGRFGSFGVHSGRLQPAPP
jgi:hypothetical protein